MPLLHQKHASRSHIEVLPDTPPPNLRSQLLSDHTTTPETPLSTQSPEALHALLTREAAHGTTLAKSALRTTVEAREVATATAEALVRQTRQLEEVADGIDQTHETLGRAEGTIEELTKNKLRRAAERPVRGLARRVRKVSKKPAELKGKIVSRQEGGRRGGEGRNGEKRGQRGAEENDGGTSGESVSVERDDYGEFESQVVREHLQRQDRCLEETGTQVEELRRIAIGIQKEVEYQVEIVDGIDAPALTERIRENHRRILRV